MLTTSSGKIKAVKNILFNLYLMNCGNIYPLKMLQIITRWVSQLIRSFLKDMSQVSVSVRGEEAEEDIAIVSEVGPTRTRCEYTYSIFYWILKTVLYQDSRWCCQFQIAVGKAGDEILAALRCKSQSELQVTTFVGNKEFLRSITPDKIRFLGIEISHLSQSHLSPVSNSVKELKEHEVLAMIYFMFLFSQW